MGSHAAAGRAPPAGMHADRMLPLRCVSSMWSEAQNGAALVCGQTSRRLHVLRIAFQRPSPADAEPGFVEYRSEREGYRIQRPSAWEETGKAGADVLFVDPERKSTTVGVTVSPVRIASLAQFGDVAAVGQRLLGAERAKESTRSVEMLSEAERSGQSSGVPVYDFLYELDSTRGRKRILSSVAVAKNKLYIVNGNYKCEGSGCDSSADAAVEAMRRMTLTFDVI